MLDIKFVRDNPDAVKENIKKKFQDAKLPLVDEVIEKDAKYRECLKEVESLKAARNKLSKANGPLFGQLKKCTDEAQKAQLQAQIDANNAAVKADADKMAELEAEEAKLADRIQEIMYTIPQMIDPSVPIGPDDTYNVEAQRFGEPVVPDFPIPYHTEIMESFDGIDMDAAGRVAGNGFYYLLGNIARLHEAVLAYARDFMIDKGFTYVIPPFMMHGNVVQGVMSFPEMDAMMYKIEGEDLYLIGTSEHTMIGRFIDQTLDEATLPLTLTSYSPCFRKEKGAHGIEERGIYRIHQFEKQEMIVVCRPEESADWYEKLWKNSVDVSFISLKLILPPLNGLLKDGGHAACLVKPQFEAGREKVGKKGVVRDPAVHLEVLEHFLDHAGDAGFTVLGLTYSPIRGPEGNIEYLGYLEKGPRQERTFDLKALVDESHQTLKEHGEGGNP